MNKVRVLSVIALVVACGESSDGAGKAGGREPPDAGTADAGSGGARGGGDSGSASGGEVAAGSGGDDGGSGGVPTGGSGGMDGPDAARSGGAPGDAGQTAFTIRCGDEVCQAMTERCSINPYGEEPVAACVPTEQASCPGGCLIAACDGPEDCPEGEPCGYHIGESSYLVCQAPPAAAVLCSRDSDCPTDAPRCERIEPSDTLTTLLGWRPGSCAPEL